MLNSRFGCRKPWPQQEQGQGQWLQGPGLSSPLQDWVCRRSQDRPAGRAQTKQEHWRQAKTRLKMEIWIQRRKGEPQQSPAVQRKRLQALCPLDLKALSAVSLILLSFKHVMERENECKKRVTVVLIGHIRHWSKKNNPSSSPS